ncbi:MAG TPA: hypothetical protein VKX16_12120 [Chloroflexota bacterium]|nr:hypothetical protein [Chloroflexota bacterium]
MALGVLFIVIAIVVVFLMLVTFLGGVGMFRRGPKPSEGDDRTG